MKSPPLINTKIKTFSMSIGDTLSYEETCCDLINSKEYKRKEGVIHSIEQNYFGNYRIILIIKSNPIKVISFNFNDSLSKGIVPDEEINSYISFGSFIWKYESFGRKLSELLLIDKVGNVNFTGKLKFKKIILTEKTYKNFQ